MAAQLTLTSPVQTLLPRRCRPGVYLLKATALNWQMHTDAEGTGGGGGGVYARLMEKKRAVGCSCCNSCTSATFHQ